MNDASASSVAPLIDNGLSRKKFLLLVAFAIATHVALLVLFGTKKPYVAKPVTDVPLLQIAEADTELLALANPTLFARPNPRDFSAAIWQRATPIEKPSFRFTEPPRYLAEPANLGAAFATFMQTNRLSVFALNFKPAATLTEVAAGTEPALPKNSWLEVSGVLTKRKLLASPALPSLTFNDVLAPSLVQVLVDKSGDVISAVILPSDSLALSSAIRANIGDTNAVALARNLKFAPARELTFGEVIFHWQTVPAVVSTNAP